MRDNENKKKTSAHDFYAIYAEIGTKVLQYLLCGCFFANFSYNTLESNRLPNLFVPDLQLQKGFGECIPSRRNKVRDEKTL